MTVRARRVATLIAVALFGLVISAPAVRADYVYQEATAHDSGGTDYDTFGPPVESPVNAGANYDGIATEVTALEPSGTDILGTKAVLRAGYNPDTVSTTVSMAWRNRTLLEVDGRGFGGVVPTGGQFTQYTDEEAGVALAYDSYGMATDILQLGGINGPYALQMDYNESALVFDDPSLGLEYNEALCDSSNCIYLGWFNTDDSAGTLPGYDEWVNAVDGNVIVDAETGTKKVEWYKGTFAQFLEDEERADFELNTYMGSFGCDIETNTVWAVLNHTSPFGVVPEPSAMLLLVGGLAALLRRRKR